MNLTLTILHITPSFTSHLPSHLPLLSSHTFIHACHTIHPSLKCSPPIRGTTRPSLGNILFLFTPSLHNLLHTDLQGDNKTLGNIFSAWQTAASTTSDTTAGATQVGDGAIGQDGGVIDLQDLEYHCWCHTGRGWGDWARLLRGGLTSDEGWICCREGRH